MQLFNDVILVPRADKKEADALMKKLHKRGPVFGTDEAGRGALAGPLIAASVYLTPKQEKALMAHKLRDSKKMTPKARERLFEEMNAMGVQWCAHSATVKRIERDNILVASLWAMGRSAEELAAKIGQTPACVVVDGTERIPKLSYPQWTLIMADNLVPAVSAASVIAKVLRDRLMVEMSPKYPAYDFASNKGYPTPHHMEAVLKSGMSEVHRPSFCKFIFKNGGSTIAAD